MFSPIFLWELRHTIRGRSFFAVRFGYALLVLLIFFMQIADLENVINTARSHRSVDHFLRNTLEYRHFLLVVHFFAILLMTPILAATSITRERDLRTLELLLTTQQQSIDIVLGKWLAALAKLCLLTMPIVPPLLWIQAMLGGDWWTILIWLVCSWLLAAVGAAWSVLASTLIRHTAAAWLASYLGTGMLGASMPLFFSDAQLALWSHAIYGEAFWWTFIGFVTVPTGLCLPLAVGRLRASIAVRPAQISRNSLCLPTVGDDPILWKQRHCHDSFTPRLLRRVPPWLRACGLSIISLAALSQMRDAAIGFVAVGSGILLSIPMAALIRASSAVSSEREKNTWDALRLTYVGAEEFVSQTMAAIKSRIRLWWLALLPAVVLLLIKNVPAGVCVAVCWGVAGISIHPAAVMGLHSSVSLRSSWGSLMFAILAFAVRIPAFGAACVALGALPSCFVGVLLGALLRSEDVVIFIVAIIWLALMHLMFARTAAYHNSLTLHYLRAREGFGYS